MRHNTLTTSRKARIGVASIWSGVNQGLQALAGVASVLLLSQWLTPADYGRFAMAAAVTGFLGVLGDTGVVAALLRKRELDRTFLATGFWLTLAGATALAIVSAVAAPLVATWFGEPDLGPMAAVLALNFLAAAPSRVPTAKLMREMRFATLTLINFSSSVLSLLAAVALARRGAGPWSLIVQFLATFVLQSLLASLATRVPVNWSATNLDAARELARVGFGVGGYGFCITVARALDPILAGRYLGAQEFGLVGMGYRVVNVATVRAASALSHVFLPTLAGLGGTENRASAFARVLRMAVLVILPLPVGIATVGPELASLLPTPWHGVQVVLPALAAIAALEPLNLLSVAVITSEARSAILLRLGFLLVPLGWATAFMGGTTRSAVGLAMCILAWAVAHTLGLAWIASSTVALRSSEWVGLFRAAAPAIIMTIVVRSILHIAHVTGTPWGFALGVCTGALSYMALAWLVARQTARQVLTFVPALLGRS